MKPIQILPVAALALGMAAHAATIPVEVSKTRAGGFNARSVSPVALDGDIAVVGEPTAGAADNAEGAEGLMVFEHDGAAWSLETTLDYSALAEFAAGGGRVAVRDIGGQVRIHDSIGGFALEESLAVGDSNAPGPVAATTNRIATTRRSFDSAGGLGEVFIFEYISALDEWLEIATVEADDPEGAAGGFGDGFGGSLSIDGDVLVVGAVGFSISVAYVFERGAGGDPWGKVARLEAGAAAPGFGRAVKVSGDRIVVAGDDIVVAFERVADVWVRRAALPAFPAGVSSPVIDLDGDRLLVSYTEFDGTTATSATNWAFAYSPDVVAPSGWAFETGWAFARIFGSVPIAVSGDRMLFGGGSQVSRVRGARGAGSYLRNAGGAWVFDGNLPTGSSVANAGFGASLAASENLMVVGDPEDDHAGADSGSALVFFREIGSDGSLSWRPAARLVAETPAAGARFGEAVAVWDSGNSEAGAPTEFLIAIGAPGEDAGRGAAYLFSRLGFSGRRFVAGDGVAGDRFGEAVAVRPQTSLPNLEAMLVVGVPQASALEGAVYLFRRPYCSEEPVFPPVICSDYSFFKKIPAPGEGAELFGSSVGIADGYLAAGAPKFGAAGAVYLFFEDNGGEDNWGFAESERPTTGSGVGFGRSLDLSYPSRLGGFTLPELPLLLAVGAGNSLAPEPAFLFELGIGPIGTFGLRKVLETDLAGTSGGFGRSVAIGDGRVAVGSRFHDAGGAQNSGAVVLYEMDEGGTNHWGQTAVLQAGDADENDLLGNGVGFAGPYVVAGAAGDDDAGSNAGAVYTFRAGSYEQWVGDQPAAFLPVSGLHEDPDCDGLTNLAEFGLGSDPLDPASRAQITYEISEDPSGDMEISAEIELLAYPADHLFYQLQTSHDLQGWDLARGLPGLRRPIPTETSFTLDASDSAERFFARIVISYGGITSFGGL